MYKYILIFILLLSSMAVVNSQTDFDKVPEVTDVLFLNDVHLYPDGVDSLGMADVLIEDGIIKKIAPELEVPFNARVIASDSMFAYPAFIDMLSHTGIPKPEGRPQRPDVDFPGFPPNEVAGITPERKASSEISIGEKSISDLRKAGFSIAHVVPRGRMLPGQGCIISLAGEKAADMIMKDASSLLFQLEGARGVYPNTIIGVMAKWRDLYRNAELHARNMDNYNQAPAGKTRPKADKSLEALIPVTEKAMPVFSVAENAKDVYRSMELQKELAYTVVLADVKQADPAIAAAQEGRVSIVLSMDLPEAEDDEKKKAEEEETEKVNKVTKELKERKKESYNNYLSQAARLEKANIDFAFSMLSAKPTDLKANLKRMIEAGLSKEAAMRALTINPARMLGLDAVTGSLEEGKLANIIVLTADYLNDASSIRFSIIEGQMEEYEEKKKSSKTGDADAFIFGDWSYSLELMGEENEGTIKVMKKEGRIMVEIIDNSQPSYVMEAQEVQYDDGTLKMSVTVPDPNGEIPVSLVLNMEEGNYEGSATVGDMGTFPIEGSKIPKPEK